jgi:hypothetical protein
MPLLTLGYELLRVGELTREHELSDRTQRECFTLTIVARQLVGQLTQVAGVRVRDAA